ncbi:MAG TPA: hypothetical protein VM536_23680 [Chloroflexia bacterium]|nr:hypothetical protein [Chloroflexia bacterium]
MIHISVPGLVSGLEFGFLLLLIAAELLAGSPGGRVAVLAAIAAGFATAGLRAAVRPLPSGFLAVAGSQVVLGIVLAAAAAVLAAGRFRSAAGVAGAAAAGLGALGVAWGGGGLIAAAPVAGLLVSLLVVGATGTGFFMLGRAVTAATTPSPERGRGGWAVKVGIISAAATAFAPDLALVLGGVIVAAWTGWWTRGRRSGATYPIAPALTLLLIPAWWLMATIAGQESLAVDTLAALPTSAAAERLLAPAFLVAAWATSGLWPLQRQLPDYLLAPVGGLLLARVAMPAVPDGLAHWRALAMPLIVIGVWHAAMTERRAGIAVGLAWIALLAGSREKIVGAGLLMSVALARAWAPRLTALPRWAYTGAMAMMSVAAGVGALLAVEAGLRAEVVYTTAAVAAMIASAGQASTASARRTGAPSA